MEKMFWIDKITGVEYKDVLAKDIGGCGCHVCQLGRDSSGCEAEPCPEIFHVKTGNVYSTLQQGVDELIDYLSSLPPFPGDGEKEEVIKKFVHLKSTKD